MKKIFKDKRNILIIGITAVCFLIIAISISYAYILYTNRQKEINSLETDCINIEMEELTNAINLIDAYPVLDEVGEKNKPFRFKLTNTCGVGVNYNLNLEVMETEEGTNRIASKNIATKVDDLEKTILTNNPTTEVTYKEEDYTGVEAYTLYKGNLSPGASVTHELRLWLDASATNDSQDGKFYSKVIIESLQNQIAEYQESILNGAYPVLAGDLVPVEIDDTGRVTKANLTSEWYSYEKKRWANAVILLDKTVEYEEGAEIPESNIESYFVWIPKYSYQLWDLGTYSSLAASVDTNQVHTIPIKFGTEDTKDSNSGECTTPMTSGATGNCKIGDYMTPPAFITMGTNGLWVGKFDTSYKESTSTTAAEVNPNMANMTEEQIKEVSTKIQIKPNVYSWRNIQVANAHLASYNYQRELDSHMMKNTEWGAVAYLQHSKYGSASSIRINNNRSAITGYAAVVEPTCGYTGTNETCNKYEETDLSVDGTHTINYKNTASVVASTTGNYTGIYDMSGGAHNYMMSVMLDSTNTAPLSGRNVTYNSNFNGAYSEGGTHTGGINFPSTRYFDTYTYSTSSTTFQRRILGDGTSEFGPFASTTYETQTRQAGSWYADESWFVYPAGPWISRGSYMVYGLSAGIFSFHLNYGSSVSSTGFRVVLAV